MGIQGLYANNGFNLRAATKEHLITSGALPGWKNPKKNCRRSFAKMGNNISGRTDAWVNLFSLEILLLVAFPKKCKYAEAFLGNMGAVGHRPRFSLVPEKWEHRFIRMLRQ